MYVTRSPKVHMNHNHRGKESDRQRGDSRFIFENEVIAVTVTTVTNV